MLGVELTINELFEEATVAGMARVVTRSRAAPGSQGDALAEKLALVESMSDQEVKQMLAELEVEA